MDIRKKVLSFVMWLMVCVFVLAVAALIFYRFNKIATSAQTESQSYPCPLDAHTYDSPNWFPECSRVMEVADTRTNQRWWVLKTIEAGKIDYVVLPVTPTGDMG